MSWYQTKKASKLSTMDKNKILVFDTETTGKIPTTDEILQITILNGYGSTLFSSYIKPARRKRWPGAAKYNHITYDMVENAPTFQEVKKEIQELFNNAVLIVGYNVSFDINFVQAAGIIVSGQTFDVMTEFARYYGGTNMKLKECAKYFGYSYSPHDSEEDAQATLYCFNQLINDSRFTTYKRSEKKVLKEEKPKTEKKVNTSIQLKTRKKLPLLFRAIVLLCICWILAYALFSVRIQTIDEYCSYAIHIMRTNPISKPELAILVGSVIGIIMGVIGIVRIIIKTPKWIAVQLKRLANKFN